MLYDCDREHCERVLVRWDCDAIQLWNDVMPVGMLDAKLRSWMI